MDRRTVLAAAVASGVASVLPVTAATGSGGVMRTRAQSLIDQLDAPQRDAILFSFDGSQRRAWNFMLGSARAPGLALEQMTEPQKDAALELLATGTSGSGLEKAMNIMLQQDILRDEWGKGSADRNRERFCVQIYGQPAATGAWAWRWEGHHLSLTFTIVDDVVVSTTPSSFSSEPNTVPSGPYDGLVVLKDEEVLGHQLFGDLTGQARRAALVWNRAPGNIQSNRGVEASIAAENVGVPLADLTVSQGDILRRLIEVYVVDPLPAELADNKAARLAQEDMQAMRVAWGGTSPEGAVYYRITGQHTLIEFASLRNQPLHLHAVYHDIAQNFGTHTI